MSVVDYSREKKMMLTVASDAPTIEDKKQRVYDNSVYSDGEFLEATAQIRPSGKSKKLKEAAKTDADHNRESSWKTIRRIPGDVKYLDEPRSQPVHVCGGKLTLAKSDNSAKLNEAVKQFVGQADRKDKLFVEVLVDLVRRVEKLEEQKV